MRLNDKTFPMLAFLENRKPAFMMPIDESLFASFEEEFGKYLSALQNLITIAQNKYYITDTFAEAILKAEPKIVQDKKWLLPKNSTGILFQRDTATLYLTEDSDKIKLAVFGFTKDGHVCYAILNHDGTMKGVYWMKDANGVAKQDDLAMNRWINRTLITLYFIDNCETETIEWKPKQKHRLHKVKYFNESKMNITILDCSWFREIVATAPVNVNSFLRWQACGAHYEKRKLIWVSEHQRNYSRKAKKETQK